MNDDAYSRFHSYLCEIVLFYQKHKTLKFFSLAAKKWKVGAITKDMFYSYDLHKIPEGASPSKELSDNIRNNMLKERAVTRNKVNPTKGEVVAWNNNGFRSIAVLEDETSFSICVNFRGREDEQKRLWLCASLPENVELEKANATDLKRLVNILVGYYTSEIDE